MLLQPHSRGRRGTTGEGQDATGRRGVGAVHHERALGIDRDHGTARGLALDEQMTPRTQVEQPGGTPRFTSRTGRDGRSGIRCRVVPPRTYASCQSEALRVQQQKARGGVIELHRIVGAHRARGADTIERDEQRGIGGCHGRGHFQAPLGLNQVVASKGEERQALVCTDTGRIALEGGEPGRTRTIIIGKIRAHAADQVVGFRHRRVPGGTGKRHREGSVELTALPETFPEFQEGVPDGGRQ